MTRSSSLTESAAHVRGRREIRTIGMHQNKKKDSPGVGHLSYYILNIGAIMKCVALGSILTETISVYQVKNIKNISNVETYV